MKLLLYCTKAKPYLYKTEKPMIEKMFGDYHIQLNKAVLNDKCLNGKIVAKCDFKVEEIDTMALSEHVYDDYYNDNIDRISKESCLTCEQMCEYLGTTWDSKGYAIHIKNLHIFDKPKELSEYGMDFPISPIVKAPQNMMYANGIGERYILISIQPQWLCKILNGEKTIEVRKKVLKEMLMC